MSARIKGLQVAFDKDISEEAATALKEAIRCFQCVASVRFSESDSSDWMNREMVKLELRQKLFEVLK